MILELTGKDVPPGAFSHGVLTATNRKLFPAVHASAISLKEQRVPYAVVDHGLTPEQRDTLHGLDVLVLNDDPRLVNGLPNASACDKCPAIPPAAWRKPFLCTQSPFKLTAWIDADAIPLNYSHELFQYSRGFLTLDHFVDDAWAAEIYEPLNAALGAKWPIQRINAGVLCFTENAEWLQTWLTTSRIILANSGYAKLAACRDQSALIAVLGLTAPKSHPQVLSQPHWNYPADGHRNIAIAQRMRDYPRDGQGLLNFARERHPGVTVVHWMGPLKPWQL